MSYPSLLRISVIRLKVDRNGLLKLKRVFRTRERTKTLLDSLRTRSHVGISLCGRFMSYPSLLRISVIRLKVDRNGLLKLKRVFRTRERTKTLLVKL
ncbi:hypothetical protein HanXRQr2_Chr06g0266121 [Helianthus annuus]|uniref:Uncharacterized protein n=1 Tax=Helianthus annuus TaxID=4232 RepID=A0A9K3IU04_HELAN|nr:hypothetical protein HanXRQr2_Chr06g0266121 [Helianthus annuus]KAJ0945786.1 hypothetical protein HanPSC8_Chr03g0131981 [Helianthus annuus]